MIVQCPGCDQHFSYYVETLSKQKKLNLTNVNNRDVNSFQLLKYSHPSYRISAYNDYLIQNKKIPPYIDLPIAPPAPNQPYNPNDNLISSLILQDSIISDLKNLALMLSDFTILQFYTDGSYQNNSTDWSLSSKWFNFNGWNDSTSEKHTKDLKWKICCSTLSLPTLDILNRNYPLLINNNITCLFCDSDPESNHHLWTSLNFPKPSDGPIVNRDEELHPVAILLLKSFITNDIIGTISGKFNVTC
uniref:Uncharacterized protein n=1 Tax=Rhizophagus irregularis (strain DAOM 181602 / DAOM 197198 / MUCL 43194) TaxID=747089 RepID=U9T1V0_RHIID